MADEQPPQKSEFLDQSEIDKLLSQAAEAPAAKQFLLKGEVSRHKVEAYDFRNPVFLSEFELRRLRLLHEDFIRYLSARLALFLRMEFGLKMSRLTTITYNKFTDALPNPTHICLFKAEPLLGVGVLDINPRLALTLADRMLGGRGHSVKAERYLTEIEMSLIEDIVLIVLEEWCAQWKNEQELHPVVIGHENNGRFLQTSPKDAIMLVLGMEVNFGDCSEQMQIGVPYYTIEPLVKKMHARRQKDVTYSAVERRGAWLGAYDHIVMPVRAEWSAFELSLREVMSLRVGDVIELPSSLLQQTHILLNGTPKFLGTVGLDGDRAVVQITGKLPRNDQERPSAHSPYGRKSA